MNIRCTGNCTLFLLELFSQILKTLIFIFSQQIDVLAVYEGEVDCELALNLTVLPELRQQHGYELQFFTNHVGHFVLVTGLLDSLTDDGRVVILSSGAHAFAENGIEFDNLTGERDYKPWRMYGISKLANVLFARSLTARFSGTMRTANSLHPGVIETNLGRHVPDREGMYERLRPRMKSIPQGAATQCYVATRPELAGVSGRYFSDCAEADTIAAGTDDAMAEQLWTVTEEIVAAL